MQYIHSQLHGAVQVLKLNNPLQRNALSAAVLKELNQCLFAAEHAPHVKCILLTGTTDYFASGGSIAEYMPYTAPSSFLQDILSEFDTVRKLRTLTVAAVNGFALGGGFQVALQCDFIVAGESAQFGCPEMGIAAIPGVGATQVLPRYVGKSKAMEMVLAAQWLTAREAYERGLVHKVVADTAVLQSALTLSERLSTWAREDLRTLKVAMNSLVY